MTNYLFRGEIEHETVKELIDFINTTEGKIQIMFSSHGGEAPLSVVLKKVLNDNADRITLIAYWTIESAAFKIFYDFTGERYLTAGVRGMVHLPFEDITYSANLRPTYTVGKTQKENLIYYQKSTIEFAESFMTKSELRRLKKGDDVYFDFNRMQTIFPDVPYVF